MYKKIVNEKMIINKHLLNTTIMEKIFRGILSSLICSVLLFGCTKDDTSDEMTYTFQSNVSLITIGGSTPEASYCMLFEYDQDGSKINSNKIDPIEKGKDYTFTANLHATKVKVYYYHKPWYSSYGGSTIGWIQQAFYLEKGKNVKITITEESVIGPSEP